MKIRLSKRNEKYGIYGLQAQPIPIWIGELNNIVASYVSVNDVLYKVDTPHKAIDIIFKIFFTLDAEYPLNHNVLGIFFSTRYIKFLPNTIKYLKPYQ